MRITSVAALALVAIEGANATALTAQTVAELSAEAQVGVSPEAFRTWRLRALLMSSEMSEKLMSWQNPGDLNAVAAKEFGKLIGLTKDHVEDILPLADVELGGTQVGLLNFGF